MKKEKKFLDELENRLEYVSKRNRDAIVLKYANIIKERKENNERIIDILKDIGKPEEVAQKEIEKYKSVYSVEYKLNKFFSKLKRKKNNKKIDKKDKSNNKKIKEKEKKLAVKVKESKKFSLLWFFHF